MTSERRILHVVVGDAGAAIDLVPPLLKLQKQGVQLLGHVDPSPLARAGRVLNQHGISYDRRGPCGYDLRGGSPPRVLVGTSTKAIGLQVEWTAWANETGVPVWWFDDLFVNSCRRDVMHVRPDRVLCVATLGKSIVERLRPEVSAVVVGKPSFGTLPSEDEVKAIRARVRARYGLEDSDFLATFWFAGEPQDRAPAQLEQIMSHRSLFRPDTIFAFRFHPAHPRAEEMWQRSAVCGLKMIDARTENLLELYIASDAVAADYVSTDPYKLLPLGVPVVTMLFPDDLAYRQELGYPEGVPPIIMGHEGWGADSVSWLVRTLRKVHQFSDVARKMTLARANVFRELADLDGTELLAQEIIRLL